MTKQLWAPWRLEYIQSADEQDGCFLCTAAEGGDDEELLVVHRGERAFAILNRFPYASGHLMVAPRRHTADLSSFPAAEHADLAETLRRALASLAAALHPEGFNLGMNLGACAGAGVRDHLHWHIVPRWAGDTNFMPVVGDVRVMPEHLLATYGRLKPAFGWLA